MRAVVNTLDHGFSYSGSRMVTFRPTPEQLEEISRIQRADACTMAEAVRKLIDKAISK